MKVKQRAGCGLATAARRRTGRTGRAVVPAYRVGESFVRGRRRWPSGAEFSFGPAGAELTLFHPGRPVPPAVVEAVQGGPAEFALIVRPGVLVLAYRFGDAIPWADAPYSWHLQPVSRRVVPSAAAIGDPETRALLWITLVGAEDGIVHAQRGMTLDPAFTRALNSAVRDQAMGPFNADACASAISSIYGKYPDTTDRLAIAAARTAGNT